MNLIDLKYFFVILLYAVFIITLGEIIGKIIFAELLEYLRTLCSGEKMEFNAVRKRVKNRYRDKGSSALAKCLYILCFTVSLIVADYAVFGAVGRIIFPVISAPLFFIFSKLLYRVIISIMLPFEFILSCVNFVNMSLTAALYRYIYKRAASHKSKSM